MAKKKIKNKSGKHLFFDGSAFASAADYSDIAGGGYGTFGDYGFNDLGSAGGSSNIDWSNYAKGNSGNFDSPMGQYLSKLKPQGKGERDLSRRDGYSSYYRTYTGDDVVTEGVANLVNGIATTMSDKGKRPLMQVMNLPTNYALGGNLFDGGGWAGYVQAAGQGLNNIGTGMQKAPDLITEQDAVDRYGSQGVAASTTEELIDSWNSRRRLSNVDRYDVIGGNLGTEIFGRFNQNVNAANQGYLSTGNWIGAVIGGVTDLVGQGLEIWKGIDSTNKLNEKIDLANARQDAAYIAAADNLKKQQKEIAMQNLAALGGPLNNAFAEGGIYIKPSKKGTFTAAATKHGKSVQEFASQVLANPDNYSPAMVKKANFARNAAHWHANGGLMSDNFTNGVDIINTGGTHELNPHEGVPVGIAPDGEPNLVEEGEAIYNDYVFSNRLRVPKEVRNKYKLRGPKDMTFAEAFKNAQKESEERPNDPISQDSLDNFAMILARTQEAVRKYNKMKDKQEGYKMAFGGHKFSGEEWEAPEWMRDYFHGDSGFYTVRKDALNDNQQVNLDGLTPPKATIEFKKSGDKIIPVTDWDKDSIGYYSSAGEDLTDKSGKGSKSGLGINGLRLAPIFANAGAVFSDMIGLTNRPARYDYIPAFQPVTYKPVGNYVPKTHFDTRYAANQAAALAAGTRNAIMQSASPSRWANLLAADYNAQIASGELLRQAAMDDFDRLIKSETFNRETNKFNSEMGLRAASTNQDARLKYAQAALSQAKLNEDSSNAASAARAANLNALAESLGGIGSEMDARKDRDAYITSAGRGMGLNEIKAWISPGMQKEYATALGYSEDEIKAAGLKACGGKLNRKKKRGLTY